MKFGYACINTNLSRLKPRVTTNRTMRLKTFTKKGLPYVSELVLQNVSDLYQILVWNKQNNILFYRMSSDMFPWASKYKLETLPHFKEIKNILEICGKFVKKHEIRITYHPGPFNKLASLNSKVVLNTIQELTHHGEVMDLMQLSHTPYNKINIHVGLKKSPDVLKRFVTSFKKLPLSVSSRLTLENDDKPSMFSVQDLMLFYQELGVPIVFDYHHHKFCSGNLSEKEALKKAVSTWNGITPVVHWSESRDEQRPQAHSDYVSGKLETYNLKFDVMLEAKMKEEALLTWEEFKQHNNA